MIDPLVLDPPLRTEVDTLPGQVGALTIVDEPSFQHAAGLLRRLKALQDAIARVFVPHIQRALAAHRALVADRRRFEQPLRDAEAVLKSKIAAYTLAEERRRRSEACRQSAAATEARAAAIWREVEDLETAGFSTEAAELAGELVAAPLAIALTPAPLKAPGVMTREVWKYEVVDMAQVPREYFTIDHRKLGAVVRALKGTIVIPGVRVWVERTIAATNVPR